MARLQDENNEPEEKEDENNMKYGSARADAHSLRMRGWMPSGPGEPPGSHDDKSL